MSLQCRPLGQSDVPAVARVHMLAFRDSAITALGEEAVRRYYEWLLDPSHDQFVAGALEGTRLQGYLFAGRFNGALAGFLHRNRAYLGLRMITHPWLVTSPIVRDRLRIAARSLSRTYRKVAPTPKPPAAARSFGVLSIAVDPTVQGSGAGKLLMAEGERIARLREFTHMHLSVHPTNTRAVGFYERLGWVRVNESSGAWDGRMQKRL
jgi:ribosomal protein S18 acetylase RimI-like enzyme